MTTRGIDIRQSTERLLFRASLKDSDGAKVSSGTTELRLYRLNDDGTLDVYDWTADAFVAPGSGTPDDETTMTHQVRRDSSGADVATGIWTKVLSDLDALTAGQVYIAQVTNSGAFPESQEREFQFGGVEGDAPASGVVTVSATSVTAQAIASTGRLAIWTFATWRAQVTGLGSLASRTNLYFAVKKSPADSDDDAILLISESDGLLRLNGEDATGDGAKGSLTVDDADDGDVTVHVDETITAQLVPRDNLVYSLKLITTSGDANELVDTRDTDVRADVIAGVCRKTAA